MNKGNSGVTSALYMWNGLSMFWGTSYHTSPHYHNTLQLVFDIEGSFLLKDEHSEWTAYRAALIDAGHIHQLDSNSNIQLFIYLDIETEYARILRSKYLDKEKICNLNQEGLHAFKSHFFKKMLMQDDCQSLLEGCMRIFNKLIDIKQGVFHDERVVKAMRFISKNSNEKIRVKQIASEVGLSESRLRFLFKKQLGQSIQSYMRWTKVTNALKIIMEGAQLVQVAYMCGFTDASHMTKSFIETIGIPPSKVQTYEREFKIRTCSSHIFSDFETSIIDNLENAAVITTIKI